MHTSSSTGYVILSEAISSLRPGRKVGTYRMSSSSKQCYLCTRTDHLAARHFQTLATCSRRYSHVAPRLNLGGHGSLRRIRDPEIQPNKSSSYSSTSQFLNDASRSESNGLGAGGTRSGQDARSSKSLDTSTTPEISLGHHVRKFMRHVAHPVAIVTSTLTERNIDVGATVSSFNTVSLEPQSVLSVHLRLPSSTFDAIQASSVFNLHVIREGSQGAALATAFTKGNDGAGFHLLEKGKEYLPGLVDEQGGTSAPLLSPRRSHGEDGSLLGILRCEYLSESTVRMGDVAVVFGKIMEVSNYDGASTPKPGNRALIYLDGTYSQPTKPEESTETQRNNLRDAVAAFRVVQDGLQCAIQEVQLDSAAGNNPQSVVVVKEQLRRFKHSLNSAQIFNDEMVKPFLQESATPAPTMSTDVTRKSIGTSSIVGNVSKCDQSRRQGLVSSKRFFSTRAFRIPNARVLSAATDVRKTKPPGAAITADGLSRELWTLKDSVQIKSLLR